MIPWVVKSSQRPRQERRDWTKPGIEDHLPWSAIVTKARTSRYMLQTARISCQTEMKRKRFGRISGPRRDSEPSRKNWTVNGKITRNATTLEITTGIVFAKNDLISRCLSLVRAPCPLTSLGLKSATMIGYLMPKSTVTNTRTTLNAERESWMSWRVTVSGPFCGLRLCRSSSYPL